MNLVQKSEDSILYSIADRGEAFEALLKVVLHFRGRPWRVIWLPPSFGTCSARLASRCAYCGYVGGALDQ